MGPSATPHKSMSKDERKYRAESDLRTLTDVHEMPRDGGRMRAARTLARKQMMNLRKVMGGRR